MSPNSCCAWSVIPTVPASPSASTHSCSLVYRKFSGYIDLFRSFVKRGFHRHRIHGLVADHDLNVLCGNRLLRRKVTQSDVLVEGWRRAATGDPTGGGAVEEDFVAVAADAAAAHFKADELAAETA